MTTRPDLKTTLVELRVRNVDMKFLKRWASECGVSLETYLREVLEVWVQEKGVRCEEKAGDPFNAGRCGLCPLSYARKAGLRRRERHTRLKRAATHQLSILPGDELEW